MSLELENTGSMASRGDIPGREPAFYEIKWIRQLLMFCGLLVLIAACWEGGSRIHKYGQAKVTAEGEKMTLYAELKNKPAWLSKAILDRIVGETEAYACRDQATYNRLANPLDKEILAEVAANYTRIDENGVNHWARNENAWIKQITEVKRVIDKARKTQTIEIYAEYRKPAAWILANGKCYLVDDEFVRLPEEYSLNDRKVTTGLLAITGLGGGGAVKVPEAGAKFDGDDLAAGMKLVDLLDQKKFASQIDAIDVSNFNGRKDKTFSWIVLNTVWQTQDGKPRIVLWGRTPGEEKFWGISTAAKIKVLDELYLKYNRIDAGRDYVDIQGDQPKVPKLAVQGEDEGTRTAGARG